MANELIQSRFDQEADVTKSIWVDQTTGLACMAIRHPELKHWCSYVGITADHRLFGVDYDDRELTGVNVHGGITFSDHWYDNPKIWWFGFDCAHVGDYVPFTARMTGHHFEGDHYWTLEEVQQETTKLAAQIAALGLTRIE